MVLLFLQVIYTNGSSLISFGIERCNSKKLIMHVFRTLLDRVLTDGNLTDPVEGMHDMLSTYGTSTCNHGCLPWACAVQLIIIHAHAVNGSGNRNKYYTCTICSQIMYQYVHSHHCMQLNITIHNFPASQCAYLVIYSADISWEEKPAHNCISFYSVYSSQLYNVTQTDLPYYRCYCNSS